jgi:hypothetical protein
MRAASAEAVRREVQREGSVTKKVLIEGVSCSQGNTDIVAACKVKARIE